MKNLLIRVFLWCGLSGIFGAIPALASDLTIPQSTLYPYGTSVEYQNDLLGSSSLSEITGFNGTRTNPGPATGRPGILRQATSAVINTIAAIALGNGGTIIAPSDSHSMLWITQLNSNDANTTVRFGTMESPVTSPPTNGIYVEKLDADTNWFCVTRAAGVQTRVDSGVAITTSYTVHAYTRNSTGVLFSINRAPVCGTISTNIPTAGVRIAAQITSSAASDKSFDADYLQFQVFGLGR